MGGEAGGTEGRRGLAERVAAHAALGWALVFLPSLLLVVPAATGSTAYLARPLNFFMEASGLAATWLLVAVLLLSPLRELLPRWGVARGLNRHRRLVGVAAFAWACAHLVFYVLDVGGWAGMMDNLDKPFIYLGMVAWLILLVLAVTSLRSWVRRLGRRWKPLHRTAYAAALLVFVHQAMQARVGWGPAAGLFVLLALAQVARVARRAAA